MFNDTVNNNISLGKEEHGFDEIISAAKTSNAHNFIVKLKEKYNTNIGDGGGKLSGGQKQRISIARAVLKDPQILLMDEATSSLIQSLKKWYKMLLKSYPKIELLLLLHTG